jgi:IS6 family transposase
MLGSSHVSVPRVINVDRNAAYPGAINDLKQEGLLPDASEFRPVKYLNNIVEQDHRFIKRRVKPGLGFHSYPTAWRTLPGYEMMNMSRKGQIQGVDKGNIQAQNRFMIGLFGLTA